MSGDGDRSEDLVPTFLWAYGNLVLSSPSLSFALSVSVSLSLSLSGYPYHPRLATSSLFPSFSIGAHRPNRGDIAHKRDGEVRAAGREGTY